MSRITPAVIEAAIVRQDFFTAAEGVLGQVAEAHDGDVPAHLAPHVRLAQVTLCALTLSNGHVAIGVNYGPVDPGDFSASKARELARANAVDQLWPLFGFALREQLAAATPEDWDGRTGPALTQLARDRAASEPQPETPPA